ncbi:hypothetical protein ACJX0J_014374 [Zea mays]
MKNLWGGLMVEKELGLLDDEEEEPEAEREEEEDEDEIEEFIPVVAIISIVPCLYKLHSLITDPYDNLGLYTNIIYQWKTFLSGIRMRNTTSSLGGLGDYM